MHFDAEKGIVAYIFGVEIEFEGISLLLLGGGHGGYIPHFE